MLLAGRLAAVAGEENMSIHLSSPDSLFRFIHPRVSVKLRSLAGASLIPAAIAAVVAGSPVAPALADNAPQTTPAKPAGSSIRIVTMRTGPTRSGSATATSQKASISGTSCSSPRLNLGRPTIQMFMAARSMFAGIFCQQFVPSLICAPNFPNISSIFHWSARRISIKPIVEMIKPI